MPSPRFPHLRRARTAVAASILTSIGLAALPLASAHGAASAGSAAAGRRTIASAPLVVHALRAADAPSAAEAQPATAKPLSPAAIRKAYALPSRGAAHQTIAVISAFNDPTEASDLAVYDKYFHLPACTEADGCLTVLNQQGQASPLPGADSSGGTWVTESALGTELAHGLCQSCRIMLVEASFADAPDFSEAAEAAQKAGATVVVTTYTPAEPANESDYEVAYDGAHEAVVAATGDSGYSGELSFPASLPQALAVGGTSLTLGGSGQYGAESAWDGTTSGCSLYEKAPAWQKRIMAASGCGGYRAGADLSAMSAPGAIIYASGIQGSQGGSFYQAEGTSVSAPIVGAVIGLAGSVGDQEAGMLYARQASNAAGLHDVTTGSDAQDCTQTICRAGRGWDGPTGLGTPDGLGEFLPGGPVISAKRPEVGISARRNTIGLSRAWAGSVTIANGNPFRISGTATLRRTLRVNGRLRTLVFASTPLIRTSLQSSSLKLTVKRSERRLLSRDHRLSAWLFVRVHGAQGRTVLIRHELELVAP